MLDRYRPDVVRVADFDAADDDKTGIAVDDFVEPRQVLFEDGGIGDRLEDRTGLIDVAHGVIFERGGSDFLREVGVKSGPVRQRQDLARPRVLHHDGCGLGLGVLDGPVDFLFDNVLDFLVDGEHDIGARIGLAFDAPKPAAAGVLGNHQRPGIAPQLLVEGDLHTRQSFVVQTYIAQGLRGQLALGIKPLRLFLEADSAQVQGANSLGCFGVDFARDPGEVFLRLHPRQDLLGVAVEHAGEDGSGVGLIGNFQGNSVNGVDQHRHGQFLAIAIIDNATLGRNLNAAQLLAGGAQHKRVALEHLQVNQPGRDGQHPKPEQTAKQHQPRPYAVSGDHRRPRVHYQRTPPEASSNRAPAAPRRSAERGGLERRSGVDKKIGGLKKPPLAGSFPLAFPAPEKLLLNT